MSFNVREWASHELQAEWDALGTAIAGEREEWLGAVARGEGAAFNRVREAAEQEAGRHIPAGEALVIAEVARHMLGGRVSSPSPEAVRALLEGPERLSYAEVAKRLGATREQIRWIARSNGFQASAAPGRKPKAKLEPAHLPEATRAPLRAALELVDAAPSPASREAAIGILLERVREFVASDL